MNEFMKKEYTPDLEFQLKLTSWSFYKKLEGLDFDICCLKY